MPESVAAACLSQKPRVKLSPDVATLSARPSHGTCRTIRLPTPPHESPPPARRSTSGIHTRNPQPDNPTVEDNHICPSARSGPIPASFHRRAPHQGAARATTHRIRSRCARQPAPSPSRLPNHSPGRQIHAEGRLCPGATRARHLTDAQGRRQIRATLHWICSAHASYRVPDQHRHGQHRTRPPPRALACAHCSAGPRPLLVVASPPPQRPTRAENLHRD